MEQGDKGDLCLCLGSSLSVPPSCNIPEKFGTQTAGMMGMGSWLGGESAKKLVIVNLTKTPLTPHADIHIHAMIDDVMRLLMKKLEIPIPEWRLKRYVRVERDISESG